MSNHYLVSTKEIQRYLISQGIADGPIDKNFDDTVRLDHLEMLLDKKGVDHSSWDVPRIIIAAQQLIFKDAGADPGKIDGLIGPNTLYALEQWQNIIRDVEVPKIVVKAIGKSKVWPREKNAEEFYGAPGTGHTHLELPYPMRLAWDLNTEISRMLIHSKCADSAGRVLTRVKELYGMRDIKRLGLDLFGGSFNNRPKRGGTSKSMHAYACAIDFDPVRNQLRWGADKARLALPSCEAWWSFWEEEGWVSLGRERNYDWMHVQAAAL